MKYTMDEKAIIFIDSFEYLENKHKRALLSLVQQPKDLFSMNQNVMDYINQNLNEEQANLIKNACNNEYVIKVLNKLIESQVLAITYISQNYPTRLQNLEFRPIIIYAKGKVELLNCNHTVGMIGSRKLKTNYRKKGQDMAKAISNNDVTIVSGIAEGGDEVALRGGLSGSGNVISVLAYGHDYVYPETNRQLLDKVADSGLVITEYFPWVKPQRYNFPIRNRIIAGLSDGLLVLGGSHKSGTRHTYSYALDFGKDIFALPYEIEVTAGEICNQIIKEGGGLVTDYKDVLEGLRIPVKAEVAKVCITKKESEIVEIIAQGTGYIDELINKSGLKIFQIMPIVTNLEIKGVILKSIDNCFSVVNSDLEVQD